MDETAPHLPSGMPDTDDAPETASDAEKQLIDRLDEAALTFSEALLSYEKTEDGQDYKIPWGMRVEIFKLVMNWVAVRRRTDISDPEGQGRMVSVMQGKLASAQEAAKLNKDGLPARPNGRPTNERKAVYDKLIEEKKAEKARASQNDDSALKARLAKLAPQKETAQ